MNANALPRLAGPDENAAPRARQSILIVDDQRSNVLVLEAILEGEFDVTTATGGAEALDLCRTHPPDLILLDVNMPGLDGHEVCRRIKRDRATRNITVIFVTGMNTPADEARGFNEGAADFISKPFHETIVRARVRCQAAVKAQAEALRSFAATDGLTGVANRRRFDEALDVEWRRARRARGPLSLLILDVDRFKAYNDRYGHQAGDVCLQSIAGTLKGFARRPGDLAARYGGEEFALILPGATAPFAIATAQATLAAIESLAINHAGNAACGGVVTASVGVATYLPHEHETGPEALLKAADELLYEAKRGGRNRALSIADTPRDPVPPIPPNEEQRVAQVEAFAAGRAAAYSTFLDDIARLAAELAGTPIALVSLVGREDQFFVGRHGLDTSGTPRAMSFCAHAMTGDAPLMIRDAALDPRFANNALVTGEMHLRFYAGAPLRSIAGGPSLGTLCVIDRAPREPLTAGQLAQLEILARLATACIDASVPAAVMAAASPLE